MPAGFDIRLKDGAVASVRLTVVKIEDDKSGDVPGRTRDLENLLCGSLAGAMPRTAVAGEIIAARSTADEGRA